MVNLNLQSSNSSKKKKTKLGLFDEPQAKKHEK